MEGEPGVRFNNLGDGRGGRADGIQIKGMNKIKGAHKRNAGCLVPDTRADARDRTVNVTPASHPER